MTLKWFHSCYQELKSPKPVLPLDFLVATAPLVDGPLSSSGAERFLKEEEEEDEDINTARTFTVNQPFPRRRVGDL